MTTLESSIILSKGIFFIKFLIRYFLSSSFEKGSCEVNHELLRRILPKSTSFDDLTQEDINLIMSHINSYKRKKLNNVSPHTLFSAIYGKDTIDKLGIQEIEPNSVSLSKSILKK